MSIVGVGPISVTIYRDDGVMKTVRITPAVVDDPETFDGCRTCRLGLADLDARALE